jgi:hypothetical protein
METRARSSAVAPHKRGGTELERLLHARLSLGKLCRHSRTQIGLLLIANYRQFPQNESSAAKPKQVGAV